VEGGRGKERWEGGGGPLSMNKARQNCATTKNPKEKSYQPMDFKNLEKKIREPKVSRLLPNLCDFHKISYLRVWIYKSINNL
jgi:hypothetical protein